MKKWFLSYLDSLQNDIPHDVYVGLLSILCIGAVVLMAWRGVKAWRQIVGLLLVEYVFVLFCVTVMFREPTEEAAFNLEPFWTYWEISKGVRDDLLPQVIMNMVVFVPVGIMSGIFVQRLNHCNWWMTAIVTGLLSSLCIETMQFLFKRGFAELDDVIHNTLGCLLGFMIYRGIGMLCALITRRPS